MYLYCIYPSILKGILPLKCKLSEGKIQISIVGRIDCKNLGKYPSDILVINAAVHL